MITTFDLNENGVIYAENILPKFCNFDSVADFDFAVTSGTGTVSLFSMPLGVYQNSINQGTGALFASSLAFDVDDLVFQSSGTKDGFSTSDPTLGLISACFYKVANQNVVVELEVYYSAVLYETLEFDLSGYPSEKWIRLGQTLDLNIGDYTFKWILKADTSSATAFCNIYIDSFCVQHYNKYGVDGLYAYQPARGVLIEHTETLDFPSIPSNQTAEITFTINGAKLGDFVQRAVPVVSQLTGLIYGIPDVVADNTVSFPVHNSTGGALNPASGAFKFKIER